MVAGSLSDNQEEELNRMAEKLERDLELVGLTAIEDKLQVCTTLPPQLLSQQMESPRMKILCKHK